MSLKGSSIDSRLTLFPICSQSLNKAILPIRSKPPLPKQPKQPNPSINPFTFSAKTSYRSSSSYSSHLS
ncbi:hypothetical protein PGT21_020195 [Puccinia graminis f. sp. tritici]|uniref:Uncharacterized protein n=1 Tax=Puccinia graminis f. sp. tritici TaxID=56615 RepID=A0A5B0Q645_PUCGR|nr:hypothetical protein PGT21_020195 [Puccinia graminis f. sp. tritici]